MDCSCLGADAEAARKAIGAAELVETLIDDSHFIAGIRRCATCGQLWLTLFCECVDWADGDDPATRIAAPITDEEEARLRAGNARRESVILAALVGPRRLLVHDMPKGRDATLEWVLRPLYVPVHD